MMIRVEREHNTPWWTAVYEHGRNEVRWKGGSGVNAIGDLMKVLLESGIITDGCCVDFKIPEDMVKAHNRWYFGEEDQT